MNAFIKNPDKVIPTMLCLMYGFIILGALTGN